ncbi:hypothetical protein PHMEG_00041516 [Phytophthora megakarya]|uniref:Reverse transcriptase Ty1/copia-type domain-containing protein n=1 Tax=Phytophthora megakarya TaxID=4795 RepID=A0A225UB98_9STRA|nr:hypothetical protein PHMEG_00041516 [Phytophthora megakarya]
MARPDAARWREATDAEIASLLKNKTWTLVKLPAGKRALACKWVFKRKFNSDGTLERYKARLVVIGCQQIKFIDFDDVFAPVVPWNHSECCLQLCALKTWNVSKWTSRPLS